MFFSMHKFIGGVGGPGVLVAKKHLFTNKVPGHCGGGTVFFVSTAIARTVNTSVHDFTLLKHLTALLHFTTFFKIDILPDLKII